MNLVFGGLCRLADENRVRGVFLTLLRVPASVRRQRSGPSLALAFDFKMVACDAGWQAGLVSYLINQRFRVVVGYYLYAHLHRRNYEKFQSPSKRQAF